MMHTCTHEAARAYAPACPDGAPCLPACLLVYFVPTRTVKCEQFRTSRDGGFNPREERLPEPRL
eukprot:6305647-Prymnesium_polylepis.1